VDVLVNAALSVDGKLSTVEREQLRISGPADFDRVDELRAGRDAVMVGIGTVLADDPSLTVDDPDRVAARERRGDPPQPARVVADSRARTPPDARILDGAADTYVLVADAAPDDRIRAMEKRNATVLCAGRDRVDLRAALDSLERHGVGSLLVEGGGELLFSLFDAQLVDGLRVYVGSLVVGGRDAPTLVDGDGFTGAFPALSLEQVQRIDDGVVLEYGIDYSNIK